MLGNGNVMFGGANVMFCHGHVMLGDGNVMFGDGNVMFGDGFSCLATKCNCGTAYGGGGGYWAKHNITTQQNPCLSRKQTHIK